LAEAAVGTGLGRGGHEDDRLIDLRPIAAHDVVTLAEDHAIPTLVLLPGLDGTGKLFSYFVVALGPSIDTQIVAYPVDQRLGYAELETLVRAALPKGGRYVLLAESFSGPIGIRIAADPPLGLLGLILCVTFAKNPYPLLAWTHSWAAVFPVRSLPRWMRAPFMGGGLSADGVPVDVERATASVDEEVLRHRIAAVLAVDETKALARIRIATLVLQATSDHVVPSAASKDILRTLPSAQHIEVEGQHLLLQTRPTECAAAVMGFVKAL
jgi:pimeloyl-ACP methyl ester carboxylesterase